MENRIFDLEAVKKESPDAATKTPIFGTDSTSGVVWVVKPGQTVGKHKHTTSDDVWIVMQGEGIFYPEPGKEVPIHKGMVIINPKGSCHGCTNTGTEDIVFVGVLAPVPSDYEAITD